MVTRPVPSDDSSHDAPDQPVEDAPNQPEGKDDPQEKQDEVADERSEDSFPASDAPSW